MRSLDLHNRRAIERVVAGMSTEELSSRVQQGGLSRLAERVAMDELARRVLAEEVDFGPGTRGIAPRVLYVASCIALVLAYLALYGYLAYSAGAPAH